ncbi:MAG TPA: hypothetical protein VMQ76_04435 [Terracidiphilus sp.]|nr:hypothetical protein [Terracidiphilus sp.]
MERENELSDADILRLGAPLEGAAACEEGLANSAGQWIRDTVCMMLDAGCSHAEIRAYIKEFRPCAN